MKLELSRLIFEKPSNMKFNENLFSGSWVGPCGQRDRRMGANMTKLTVAFRNFENAPKKRRHSWEESSLWRHLSAVAGYNSTVSDLHARRSNTSFRRTERIPALSEFRCNKHRIGSTPTPVYICRNFLLYSELHRNVQEIYDLPLISHTNTEWLKSHPLQAPVKEY